MLLPRAESLNSVDGMFLGKVGGARWVMVDIMLHIKLFLRCCSEVMPNSSSFHDASQCDRSFPKSHAEVHTRNPKYRQQRGMKWAIEGMAASDSAGVMMLLHFQFTQSGHRPDKSHNKVEFYPFHG